MNNNRIKSIISTVFASTLTACWPMKSGASVTLTNIPFGAWQTNSLGETDIANGAYGVSPDGKYIIGYSSPGNNKGYLYDVDNAVLRRPLAEGAAPNVLCGIAYRTDTNQDPPQVQLVLDGQSSGYQTDWMTADGGITWGAKRRNTSFTDASLPVANSLAATTGSDAFYTIVKNSSSRNAYTLLGVGLWTSTSGVVPTMTYINKGVNSPSTLSMNAVAATGRVGGYRNDGAARYNYVMDYPPASGTAFAFAGLDGSTLGEVFSLSQDGSIAFGHSPVIDPFTNPGRWPYKAVLDTSTVPGSMISIAQLPWFPDTSGAGGNAGVPYACTTDGKYAVGMSYRGQERAALWDTSDPNPANWQVVDLTSLAEANGNLDIFLRLSRAYGVATNAAGNLVITGIGADTNFNTRAFVMTVTPPLTSVGFPPVVAVSGSYPAGFSFTFPTITNALGVATVSNFLEYTTDLTPPATWTVITGEQSTGGPITLSDPNPSGSQRFYRVYVTQ